MGSGADDQRGAGLGAAGHEHQQPAAGAGPDVTVEPRRTASAGHQQIDPPVAVEVAGRQGAAVVDMAGEVARIGGAETATAVVEQQQVGLGVGRPEALPRPRQPRSARHPAVDDRQIEVAVGVAVDEGGAEAGHRAARRRQPGAEGGVGVAGGAVVAVEGVALAPQVGDEEVLVAVAVGVAGGDPHPRLRPAELVERHSPGESHLLQLAAAETAPELVRLAVVGDVEIEPAVAVEVAGHHAQPLAGVPRERRIAGGLEAAVTTVAVEPVGYPGEAVRATVVGPAGGVGADGGGVVVEIADDEEIGEAVGVDVDQRRRAPPAAVAQPGGGGGVLEAAVAAIAVEGVRPPVGEVEIRVAVAVDVADRQAHAVAAVAGAGGRGDVDEAPVALLAEQPVGERRARALAPRSVEQVDVEIAVAVVVDEAAARAEALGHEVAAFDGGVVDEGEAPPTGHVGEAAARLRRCHPGDRQHQDAGAAGAAPVSRPAPRHRAPPARSAARAGAAARRAARRARPGTRRSSSRSPRA